MNSVFYICLLNMHGQIYILLGDEDASEEGFPIAAWQHEADVARQFWSDRGPDVGQILLNGMLNPSVVQAESLEWINENVIGSDKISIERVHGGLMLGSMYVAKANAEGARELWENGYKP